MSILDAGMIAPHTALDVVDGLLDNAPPALRAWLLTSVPAPGSYAERDVLYPRIAWALKLGSARMTDVKLAEAHLRDAYVAHQTVANVMARMDELVETYAAALKAYTRNRANRAALLAVVRALSAVVESLYYLYTEGPRMNALLRDVTKGEYPEGRRLALARALRAQEEKGDDLIDAASVGLDYYSERLPAAYIALREGGALPNGWQQRLDAKLDADLKPAAFARVVTGLHRALNKGQTDWNDWVDKHKYGSFRFPFMRPSARDLGNRRMVELGGLPVTLNGEVDVPEEVAVRYRDRARIVLETYAERCRRAFPRLHANLTPHIDVWFYNPQGAKSPSGHYYHSGRGVGLYAENLSFFTQPEPTRTHLDAAVQVLAHEAGHHIWKTVLRPEQREIWEKLVTQRVPLDYTAILRAWDTVHAAAGLAPQKLIDLFPYLREENPELYLQILIASSVYDPNYSKKKGGTPWKWSNAPLHWYRRGDVEHRASVQTGGGRYASDKVPALPITAYAATNPEEAWCDAFGNLIAHGKGTVLEPIRDLIYTFFPEIRRNPDDGEDVLPALAADT